MNKLVNGLADICGIALALVVIPFLLISRIPYLFNGTGIVALTLFVQIELPKHFGSGVTGMELMQIAEAQFSPKKVSPLLLGMVLAALVDSGRARVEKSVEDMLPDEAADSLRAHAMRDLKHSRYYPTPRRPRRDSRRSSTSAQTSGPILAPA